MFLGREIRAKQPIALNKGGSLVDILQQFHQADDSMEGRDLGHRLLHVSEGGHVPFGLKEMSTQILDDDCESSTLLAKLAKKTSLAFHQTARMQARLSTGECQSSHAEALRDACAGWPIFKNLTPKSWDLLSRIFERGNTMVERGHLRIMSTIGLATSASAAEVQKDPSSLSGHCFNVGFIKTPSMDECKCILLEGTAAMIMVPVTDVSSRYTVDLYDEEGNKTAAQTMDLCSLLTPLGGTVQMLSQMINAPNGAGMPQGGGWPFKCKVTGWMARTTAMNTLDSDAKYPLRFYNRILFTGWSCTASGLGCLPVKEGGSGGQGGISSGAAGGGSVGKKKVMGCHPYDLSDVRLRGFSAELTAEENRLMGEIMDETTAPMVKPQVLQQISDFWVPCSPVEGVNQRKNGSHADGMKYVRIAVMETPGVPEYIPLMLEAKGRLMKATSDINSARPDSDGIVCSVYPLGTGVHILIDVPDFSPATTEEARKLTFVDSMRQAMLKVGWPGADQSLQRKKHVSSCLA